MLERFLVAGALAFLLHVTIFPVVKLFLLEIWRDLIALVQLEQLSQTQGNVIERRYQVLAYCPYQRRSADRIDITNEQF